MGLSAEMAYNAMLALFPAILAILTAIGFFEESLQPTFRRLAEQLGQIAPEAAATLIRSFVDNLHLSRSQRLFSLSFAVALWISSGAMSAAMNALDQIHRIPANQKRPFWQAKLISLALTLGTITLLVVACFLVFISDWLLGIAVAASPIETLKIALLSGWRLLRWPLALGLVSLAFALVYRYGPSRWRPKTQIIPGAIFGALLWAFLSAMFRLYVSRFGNYNRVYGAVGAVIVLMLWLYLSSLALLLGDQLNVIIGKAMQPKRKPRSRTKKKKEVTEKTALSPPSDSHQTAETIESPTSSTNMTEESPDRASASAAKDTAPPKETSSRSKKRKATQEKKTSGSKQKTTSETKPEEPSDKT